MASSSNDLDQSLLSLERLEDRTSPDLWPEQIPGVSDFALTLQEGSPPQWLADVERNDPDMIQEFGSLTSSLLVEKVRGLQELAFQLGLEEAHEMVRGKFLNILSRPAQKRAP